HPLAAALVSRRAPTERRATAVGTLNFAGDLGKMAGPPLVALVAIPFGWRAALIALGVFGLIFSVAIARLPVGRGRASPGPGPRVPGAPQPPNPGGFPEPPGIGGLGGGESSERVRRGAAGYVRDWGIEQ